MQNIKKGLVGLLAAAVLCVGVGYTLPVAADSTNTQIQINSTLKRTHISPTEYAFSAPEGTCLMVEHQEGTNAYTVSYEPGIIESGVLSKVWQNFKGSNDSVNNVAYLSYSLMNCENAALEEMARKASFVLIDVADGVAPVRHVEKYRAFAETGGYNLLFAEATVSDEPATEVNAFAGDKWVKGTEVRMRAKPNTDCEILGYFDEHEYVKVLGYVDAADASAYPGSWAYVVRDNRQKGFIAAQFLATGPAVTDAEQYLRDHIKNCGKYESWKGIDYKLALTETYSGEGPRAVTTSVYKVYENRGNEQVTLAVFYVRDDGGIGKDIDGYDVRDN